MHPFYTQFVKPYYYQPHRFYHGENHLNQMMTQVALMGLVLTDTQRLALWYHDAVYIPGSPHNEAQSADLWRCIYAQHKDLIDQKFPTVNPTRVASIILDTKNHIPTCEESALVLDLDMSILGQSRKYYSTYVSQIMAEFVHVPELLLDDGRRNFLAKTLQGRIFHTGLFYEHFEANARINLEYEIDLIDKRLLKHCQPRTK